MMRMVFKWTKYRTRVVLALWCVFLLAIPVTAAAQPGTDPFATAENLILGGQYHKALETYRKRYQSSTQSRAKAQALFFMASMYRYYLNQPEQALNIYRDIQQNFPDSPEAADALFNTGSLMYGLNLLSDARQSFEEYLDAYPEGMHAKSARAWIDLGFDTPKPPSGKKPITTPKPVLSPTMRILLLKNEDQLVFKAQDPLTVRDKHTGQILLQTTGPLVVSINNGKPHINTGSFSFRECEVTASGGVLSVEGRHYRGAIHVLVKGRGLMAVNHLPVEDYLYGVVPKEMSWLWEEEALMAQAIVSRTYALYMREYNHQKNRDYDLEASTVSQVYGGFDAEKEQTKQAVDRTRGKVITFQGRLAAAYFHANSGGYTESAVNVWGIHLPYLKSVPDPFTRDLPGTSWSVTLSAKEIHNLLKRTLPGLGTVTAIHMGKRSSSGRVLSLIIVSGKRQFTLSGNALRMALGPTRLKSTIFDIVTGHNGYTFKGTGYGHGVGMSQWGAQCMARAGYSCAAIIKQYYSGVTIGRAGYQ